MNQECHWNTTCPCKVIAAKRTKKVQQCTSGSKTQITILACASASGQTIPPMVVFPGKNFDSVLAKGEIPATLYGCLHQAGWTRNCLQTGFASFSHACNYQWAIDAFA